jgi:hypothetical protein
MTLIGTAAAAVSFCLRLSAAEVLRADASDARTEKTLSQASNPLTQGVQPTIVVQPIIMPYNGQAANGAPTQMEQQLAASLVRAAGKAGGFARTVGQSIGDYMKEKQIERTQQELVRAFYMHLNRELQSYAIDDPVVYKTIVANIERIYIEDGATDKYGLDTLYFREMPHIVRKEYADILLRQTLDGTVTTYNFDGSPKALWNLKNGKPHGYVTTYYPNGEILYIDVYESGQRLNRKKFNKEGFLEFEQDYGYTPSQPKAPEINPIPPLEEVF